MPTLLGAGLAAWMVLPIGSPAARNRGANGPLDLSAGPENHGLRLKLTISTQRVVGNDTHSVWLDLINVGTQPITLVAQWPYEQLRGDYAEFLKSAVTFLTFPEVQPPGAQTGGTARTSPQPRHVIKPGQTLTAAWIAHGPRLKPEHCFDYHNTTPEFPTDGLYSVRAKITVLTADGQRILLTSNEQPVPVGGSTRTPKYSTARVVASDPNRKTCRIDLGSDHGLEPGDVFSIRYGLLASWRLRLSKVQDQGAEGLVEDSCRAEGRDVPAPAFPERGFVATLVPREIRPPAR